MAPGQTAAHDDGGQGYRRELARNPLIVATVAGLTGNLARLHLPDPIATTLLGMLSVPLAMLALQRMQP